MRVRTCAAHSGRTSHEDLYGVFSNRAVDVFRCTLGMSCSREDGTVILGEDVQPGRDVGCMILARFQRELEIRTQERGSKLSDQFLERIPFSPLQAVEQPHPARSGELFSKETDRAVTGQPFVGWRQLHP